MLSLSKLNTYYRIIFLVLCICALFFLLYFILYIYTERQEKKVYESTLYEFQGEVNSIYKLNIKPHMSTLTDVTYWDSLVAFTKTGDKNWYKDHIAFEFPAYEVDLIEVYNLDKALLASTHSNKLRSASFLNEEAFQWIVQEKSTRFYYRLPEGIVEVYAGTIHPSDDSNKTKHSPSGFFVMARLLDREYLNHFEGITSSLVAIDSLRITSPLHEHLLTQIALKDEQQQVLSYLTFKRTFNLSFQTSRQILLIIFLVTVFNLFVFLYYYRKWVYRPLQLITQILETPDRKSIEQLKMTSGEFGRIGNLFDAYNQQRKQLEIAKRKAEESDLLKSAFLANLSHEIRTPMNAIMGFSKLINEEALSEKERSNYLQIIHESGKNLTSIIEDLIEMSRIDSKQITPNYKYIDLDQCMTDLYHSLRITIPPHKNLSLHLSKKNTSLPFRILMDEVKLKQMITNLVTNAIKFTDTGEIRVAYSVDEKKGLLLFKVTDTGLGIEKKNLRVIFDRFRRVEDDIHLERGGLGLGLSITKAYVDLMGGKITVDSTPGSGTTFLIELPFQADTCPLEIATDPAAYPSPSPQVRLKDKTILVAEDDDINYLLINKLLQLKQYRTLRATNGWQAIELLKNHPEIELVLMDIKMPKLDGFETLKHIREMKLTIPVIANTAYSSLEDKERMKAAGFDGYLPKPVQKNEMYDLLEVLLSRLSSSPESQ